MSIHRLHNVYLADTARVLGDVQLADGVNLWYGVSIRGDVARITIGEGTNVQDNAVIHCDSHIPNTIGAHVTIGHGAIVHGISVGDGTLIGMGATALGGTRIGARCLIAAGAVVPPNLNVPDDMMVIGVPGRVARPTNEKEKKYLAWLAPHYVQLARHHHENPTDGRVKPWNGNAPNR
ncbi:MAG: gamma carbonic anhydrase family protein [Phycisphaeraceae bacterium]